MPTKPPPASAPVAPATAPTAFASPFCGELQSKKYFMLNEMPTEPSHYLDEADHCWCFVTQQVIGPDGGKVHPERCRPGRSCYRSAMTAAE
jgi:hypothetical protein